MILHPNTTHLVAASPPLDAEPIPVITTPEEYVRRMGGTLKDAQAFFDGHPKGATLVIPSPAERLSNTAEANVPKETR